MTPVLFDHVFDLYFDDCIIILSQLFYSPFGRLFAVDGFISMYSSHDETLLESLGGSLGIDCTLGYVSGWGMGSS